jgi:hypothetical protein
MMLDVPGVKRAAANGAFDESVHMHMHVTNTAINRLSCQIQLSSGAVRTEMFIVLSPLPRRF